MKLAKKYFLVALAVIVVDQITKVIVKLNMAYGEVGQIKILGNFFKLHFIENEGAAFGLRISDMVQGLGGEMSEETGKLTLTIFSIVAVFAIGYVLYRLADHRSPLPWYVALIFGGAVGNIIDRTFYGIFFESINTYSGGLFHGRVVDMFYFDIWRGQIADWIPIFGGSYTSLWPIFNIADSAISVGIVVILIFQGKYFKMDERARSAESADTSSTLPASEKNVQEASTPSTEPSENKTESAPEEEPTTEPESTKENSAEVLEEQAKEVGQSQETDPK
ncbi:MAG: lipoprotein signal peptidase [Bacteroidota bacterium]